MSRKQLLKLMETQDLNKLTLPQSLFLDSLLKLPRLTEEEQEQLRSLNYKLSSCYLPITEEERDPGCGDSVGIITEETPVYRSTSRKPDKLPPDVIKAFVTGEVSRFEPYVRGTGHRERLKFVIAAVEEFLLIHGFH